ncbi:MAG: YraN family protein [Gammaproteobacteria bacterium]|nr:YraN family protein [Gammaproteobacteria bacterium]
MNQTSHNKGQHAENACCEYLKQQGLKLVARNYRGHRGEIDIILQDGNTLVFVEVRYRKNNFYGNGLESVTTQKQQRILRTAQEYMQNETKLKNGRIDVVAMSQKLQNTHSENTEDSYTFEWIKDAF